MNSFLIRVICFGIFISSLAAQEVSVYPQLGHSGEVSAVAYYPGSNLLASSGFSGGDIRVWDAETGREIKVVNLQNTLPYSLIWNNDGSRLICGSFGGFITILDYKTGAELRSWHGHTGSVNSLSLSPDGSNFLSASFDTTVRKWDSGTGEELFVYSGFESIVFQAVYSADGSKIAASCADGTIRIINTADGKELRKIQSHEGPVHSCTIDQDGNFLAAGGFDGTIKVFYAPTGVRLYTVNAHEGPVTSLTFSPDGKRIGSSSMDNTVKEWNISDGALLSTFKGHRTYISSVCYDKTGSTLYSASFDNTVKAWSSQDSRELISFAGHSRSVHDSKISSDGEYIVSAHGGELFNEDTNIRIWSARNGSLLKTLTGHKKPVVSLDISPDNGKIVSGSEDYTVRIWDMTGNQKSKTLDGHTMSVRAVSFSPNGKRIISGSFDNTVIVWDAETAGMIHKFSIDNGLIQSVAWSADGKHIAAGTRTAEIYIWDAENFEFIKKLDSAGSTVSLAYSPDNSWLVSGHYDNNAIVWDLESGEQVFQLEGHDAPVTAVRFSGDGKLIVTATGENFDSGGGKAIKIWSAESGRELASLTGHIGGINSIGISRDGKRIVSASGDTTVRIWDLDYDADLETVSWKETAQLVGFMNGEWICVTKEGYYKSSPGGTDYLNVRIGTEVYGIDRFRDTFYKPEMVTMYLSGEAGLTAKTEVSIENAGQFLPPVIEILDVAVNEEGSSADCMIGIYDEKQDITKIEFFVNDKQLGSDVLKVLEGGNGITLESASLAVAKNIRRLTFRIPIPLTDGSNWLRIRAHNNFANGEKTEVIKGIVRDELSNLWILAIGISTYETRNQKTFKSLDYAAQDASNFAESFLPQAGKVYKEVNIKIISDDNPALLPTRENILKNLDYLKNRGSNDTIMLFISGHGLNDDKDNFYLIPRDYDDSLPLSESAVSNTVLTQTLREARGSKIAFIDACHAGNIENTKNRLGNSERLANDLGNTRTVIITASKGTELSKENFKWGGGAFTYSLIQGIRGDAASRGQKKITLTSWYSYVEDTVPRLTNDEQHPDIVYPDGFRGNPVFALLE
jgi:WD40 repeat protein